MNKYVIYTIALPKSLEDERKFIYFVEDNHWSELKKAAHEFDTREEAREKADSMPFECFVEMGCAKVIGG